MKTNHYATVKVQREAMAWLEQEFPQGINEIASGEHPKFPLQLEVHPHHASTSFCTNSCEGCTGGYYRTLPKAQNAGIEPERLVNLIDNLAGTPTKRVVFAGNCTEPLMYPDIVGAIQHVRNAGLEFCLYSNFYLADRDGVLEAIASTDAVNDYVRASLDAGSAEAYNLVHHPTDPDSFTKILRNIERLLELKQTNRPNLYIHLTYLLSNHNCREEDLQFIVQWAGSHEGIDSIRFTEYQKPLGREMPASAKIPEEKLHKTFEFLKRLKSKLERQDFKIRVIEGDIITTQLIKQFTRCYVQEALAVIGFDGELYPCTAMAYPDSLPIYRFGNIDLKDFWDLWLDKERLPRLHFPLDKCYDCTRTEFEINAGLHKLISR